MASSRVFILARGHRTRGPRASGESIGAGAQANRARWLVQGQPQIPSASPILQERLVDFPDLDATAPPGFERIRNFEQSARRLFRVYIRAPIGVFHRPWPDSGVPLKIFRSKKGGDSGNCGYCEYQECKPPHPPCCALNAILHHQILCGLALQRS